MLSCRLIDFWTQAGGCHLYQISCPWAAFLLLPDRLRCPPNNNPPLGVCHLCIADTDIGQELLSCRSNLTSRQTIIPCIGHHLLGRIFHQGLASSIINLPTLELVVILVLLSLGQLIRYKSPD